MLYFRPTHASGDTETAMLWVQNGKVMVPVTFGAVAFTPSQVGYRPCDLYFGGDEPSARSGRDTAILIVSAN
jgi:hypothetical protein